MRLRFRRRRNEEIDEEIKGHIEMAARDKAERGEPAREALRSARRQFGNVVLIGELTREVWGWGSLDRFWQDVRYGLRLLRRNPGFTAAALLTLALGIGANTAIFGLVNATLFGRLPYREPEKLVSISDVVQGSPNWPTSYLNYLDCKVQSSAFEQVAAYQGNDFNLSDGSGAERVFGRGVSADFFLALGVRPILGRDIQPDDDRPGAQPVLEISFRFWQRWFGGDPGVVTKSLSLDGRSFTIIGVLPRAFRFYQQADLYAPLGLWAGEMQNRAAHSVRVIARLRPGVSMLRAQSDLDMIVQNLRRQYPDANSGRGMAVVGLREYLVRETSPVLQTLLGAVLFLLLIACVNVANLLLARGADRGREMAIRSALGASRLRVMRQLLTESMVLSLLAALLAVAAGPWAFGLLRILVPSDRRDMFDVAVDWRVLLFTALLSLATGILFGLAPAFQASKICLVESLKKAGSGYSRDSSRRFRSSLLIAEVALALILLNGGVLMLRSLNGLLKVEPGFDPSNVLAARVSLSEITYSKPVQQLAYWQNVQLATASVPGVSATAVAAWIPLDNEAWLDGIYVEGELAPTRGNLQQTHYNVVSAEYFKVLGLRLASGRCFTDGDNAQSGLVAVVNEAMARRYWPDHDPVGKRFMRGRPQDNGKWLSVVGVVGDAKIDALDEEAAPEFYIPYSQDPTAYMTILVRTGSDPIALADSVRSAILMVDGTQPPHDIKSMQQVLSASVASRRLVTLLLMIFAGLALILGAIGIYGVTFYSASRRTHEIGIRMALGSARADVLRLMLGGQLMLIIAGVSIGALGALSLARFLSGMLYGISSTDGPTLVVTSLAMTVVALVASYVPVARASHVDPIAALRYE